MRIKKVKPQSLEDWVEAQVEKGVILYRLKDGSNYGAIRRGKNPFDFIGSMRGFPLAIECKETAKNSISISKLRRKESSHQIDALLDWEEASERNVAIYVFRINGELFVALAAAIPKMGSIHRLSPFVKPITSLKEICDHLIHP